MNYDKLGFWKNFKVFESENCSCLGYLYTDDPLSASDGEGKARHNSKINSVISLILDYMAKILD